MNSTCVPEQFIFVGWEFHQHGHAASQEHDSSRSPFICQGVFFCASSPPRAAAAAPNARSTAKTRNHRIGRRFMDDLLFEFESPSQIFEPKRRVGFLPGRL